VNVAGTLTFVEPLVELAECVAVWVVTADVLELLAGEVVEGGDAEDEDALVL
jgi:hypothetical protein